MLVLIPALVWACAPAVSSTSAAMAELARYGQVPACQLDETIEQPPPKVHAARESDDDFEEETHVHRLLPPLRLEALGGHSAELLGYLRNRDRRVVERTVDLLCAGQDPAGLRAIGELAAGHPCYRWLMQAGIVARMLGGQTITQAEEAVGDLPTRSACEGLAEEPMDRTEVGIPGGPADWERWSSAKAQARGAKISAGDGAAVAEAFADLSDLDLARVREAIAAMGQVDSPEGWTQLERAFGAERQAGFALEFVQKLGPAVLHRIAAHRQISEAQAAVALVASNPASGSAVYYVVRMQPQVFQELVQLSPPYRARSAPTTLREWFARIDREALTLDLQASLRVEAQLKQQREARDIASLRVYLENETNPILHRLIAGNHLLELGDTRVLDLLEDPEVVNLVGRGTFRDFLKSALDTTTGAAHQRVETLLRPYPTEPDERLRLRDSVNALSQ